MQCAAQSLRACPAPRAAVRQRSGAVVVAAAPLALPALAAVVKAPAVLAAGGLAAAGLASLAPQPPPPPPGLREPVSVNLEGGQLPLNTHGVGRAGKVRAARR